MTTISQGTRIKNDLNAYVSDQETIRPLRDHIVVEPLDWKPSEILEVKWHGEALRGRVLAVGPGHYPKRYNGPKGKRTKSWDSNAFLPCDIQVGDIVQLGGLELRGYLFDTIMWGDGKVIICREADVVGIEDHGMGVPRCRTRNCTNFVESSEDYCTDCLDKGLAA